MAIKTSILLFYLNLASSVNNPFRFACFFTLVVVLTTHIAFMGRFTFFCSPIAAAWDLTLLAPPEYGGVGATCIDARGWFLGVAIVNSVTDFAILLMPVYLLWGIRKSRKQMVYSAVVFGLGGL